MGETYLKVYRECINTPLYIYREPLSRFHPFKNQKMDFTSRLSTTAWDLSILPFNIDWENKFMWLRGAADWVIQESIFQFLDDCKFTIGPYCYLRALLCEYPVRGSSKWWMRSLWSLWRFAPALSVNEMQYGWRSFVATVSSLTKR